MDDPHMGARGWVILTFYFAVVGSSLTYMLNALIDSFS